MTLYILQFPTTTSFIMYLHYSAKQPQITVVFLLFTTVSIHIIKQSPPPRLYVCLSAINSKTTEQIFMRFSPIDRVILPENTGI